MCNSLCVRCGRLVLNNESEALDRAAKAADGPMDRTRYSVSLLIGRQFYRPNLLCGFFANQETDLRTELVIRFFANRQTLLPTELAIRLLY